VFDTFNRVYETGKPAETLEGELIRKDKTIVHAETVVSLIRDTKHQPVGFRGIARDISDRKKAEKERKLLEDQLQQSQRLEALGKLAGGVAHDFNNLLMGIQGRASLMLLDLDPSHPHHSHLKNIESNVKSASALTNRLLGFARGGKYEARPTDLNHLIEKSIQMFGRTKKEITINTRYQEDMKPVKVDANQIEQVLLNLFVNAWQAMPNGGNLFIETKSVFLDDQSAQANRLSSGDYCRLVISDTGVGMTQETLPKIFDPFFTTKPFGHGTGMGLAMVYGIIKNHHGAITVESEPNQGTAFTIFLPVTRERITGDAQPKRGIQRGTETILLVDDETTIISVGEQLLQALGYTALTATSGSEAINIYRQQRHTIALVIIDLVMPEMSGGELFDRLTAINPGIRTLLSSGYSINGQALEIIDRGCDGFIQKPFDIDQLSIKIRDILDRK
jgi:signal transduction histidine kinase/CheY-like chemotaxis protein